MRVRSVWTGDGASILSRFVCFVSPFRRCDFRCTSAAEKNPRSEKRGQRSEVGRGDQRGTWPRGRSSPARTEVQVSSIHHLDHPTRSRCPITQYGRSCTYEASRRISFTCQPHTNSSVSSRRRLPPTLQDPAVHPPHRLSSTSSSSTPRPATVAEDGGPVRFSVRRMSSSHSGSHSLARLDKEEIREREQLVNEYEAEEERLVNVLGRRMEEVRMGPSLGIRGRVGGGKSD